MKMFQNEIPILVVFVIGVASNEINLDDKIKILQKEKDELFIQINNGIAESINALRDANETEAISYLEKLKLEMAKLDEFDNLTLLSIDLNDAHNNSNSNDKGVKSRRYLEELEQRDEYSKKREEFKKTYDYFFGKRESGKYAKKHINRLDRDIPKMQVQIDKWLEQKRKERYLIDSLDQKIENDFEKCPREGRKKGKRAKSGTRRSKKNSLNTYPCCRKCCKRSYIGCLK